jgi:type II secretory pathway pseudopilin PulG
VALLSVEGVCWKRSADARFGRGRVHTDRNDDRRGDHRDPGGDLGAEFHARAQAQTAACEANLKEIATALEEYQTDHEAYPDVTSATNVTSTEPNLGQYVRQTPIDPVNPTGYYQYQVANYNAGNASYTIICPGQHDPATLTAIGGGSSATHIQYASSSGFTAVASQ